MIKSFKSKALKLYFEKSDGRKLPADMLDKINEILTVLDFSENLNDANLPGYRFHPLKADLKGYYAITVRANWRIIFRFDNGHVYDVDFLDYH